MRSTPWSWKQWSKLAVYDVFFLIVIGFVMTATSQLSIFGQLVWLLGLAAVSALIGLCLSILTRYLALIDSRTVRIVLWLILVAVFISPLVVGSLWVWELKAGLDALALLVGGLAGFFWCQLDRWRRSVRAGTVQPSRLA